MPARSLPARAGIALASVLALALAPLPYFLTACNSTSNFGDNIQWAVVVIVIVAMAFPVYLAAAAAVVFALVFALSNSERGVRIRNRAIPAAVAAIVVGALIYGTVVPTRCSFF